MPKLMHLAGAILIFMSVCYGNENNPPKAFVCSNPTSSSPSSPSSANAEAGIFGNGDSSHGDSEERHSIVMETGVGSKDPNWLLQPEVDGILRRKRRSASMNERLQRQLDSTDDVIPGVHYNRLLHRPGDLKFIYESGLDNPSGEEVIANSAKDNGLLGWRYPGGISDDDDGPSGIWKAYKELGLLSERADPEPVYETERKRKWKSKNMAMWG